MSDQRQDHDATRACACVRACVCGSMVSHTSCKVHVVVSRTSCKRCCHECTLHVPCNHHISGIHVAYVTRAGYAAMQSIVCVPTIVCSNCRTREPNVTSIVKYDTEGRWSWAGKRYGPTQRTTGPNHHRQQQHHCHQHRHHHHHNQHQHATPLLLP